MNSCLFLFVGFLFICSVFYLIDHFLGSDGKISTASQRMDVIRVLRNISNHEFYGTTICDELRHEVFTFLIPLLSAEGSMINFAIFFLFSYLDGYLVQFLTNKNTKTQKFWKNLIYDLDEIAENHSKR